jgi:proline iminopeptidase
MNKFLKKKIMGSLFTFILIIAGLFLIVTIGGIISRQCVYTPPFTGSDGNKIPESIAEFSHIKLGGYSQAILIRGKNINNPVILYLHAGPGLSETGLSRNFNASLEDYYTFVYLDQRGGGKSYSPFLDASTMNTGQLLQDIHELTQYLKKRFGKEKIVLMGHSFGAGFGALAAARYPEDYSTYIGIGQPVCVSDIDRLSYAWTVEQSKKTGNTKALKELEKVNGYWKRKDQKGYFNGMMVNKQLVGYYGGQVYGQKGFLSFVLKNSLCHEFTVFDYVPYLLGMNFSGHNTWEIMISLDLRAQATDFQCPFIMMAGRNDYNAVPELMQEYYNLIKAPVKKLYWFEKSAHFPNFEESDLFQKIMIDEVLPIVKDK